MPSERRTSNRRKFGYYMPVYDNSTNECVGYLSDISARGFRLESQKALVVHTVYQLRLNLTAEISKTSYIGFFAEVVWSQPDPITPIDYIHGFQIVSIAPGEQATYQRLVEKYGQSESKW